MAGSRIVAMGHYQPSRVVTNDEIAQMVDTNDEWIRDRVGIATRRIAGDETVADMATAAAGKALANSGLTAADIDLVVVATCSSVDRSPNVACRVAAKLGINAPGRVRPQHRLLRLRVRAGHRGPRDPGRRGAQRDRRRRREALRLHRLDRPLDLHHLRRRRRGGGGHRDRRRRAGRDRAGGLGLRAGEERRGTHRGLAAVHRAGGAVGVPLGHHRAGPARAAGLRAGRRGTRRSWPRSCRTRPTAGSSTASRSG